MPDSSLSQLNLTDEDRQGFKAFWEVYEAHYNEISEASSRDLADHPEFGPLLRAASSEQMAEQGRQGLERMRRALLHDEWQPYLDNLKMQGEIYAHGTISF